MIQSVLFLLLLSAALSAPAQEKISGGRLSLVRSGASDTGDLSGTWTGAIQTPAKSIPFCIVLRYDRETLIATIGPDPQHQSGWPVSLTAGVLRFRPDFVSEVSLTLQDGRLVGGIARVLSDARPEMPLPYETAGLDRIIPVLLAAFDHTDILALGESGHRRKLDSELRLRLIRDPAFARKVRFIVVEFGNHGYQAILDRYVSGEDVPLHELQQVWGITTQPGVWDSPVYAEFFAAVREVNRKLPRNRQIRVLAGDPPTDSPETRNSSPASLLRQVLNQGGKALLLYGGGHLDRYSGIPNLVQATHPGRIFVVDAIGGPDPKYQRFEDALQSRERPVLVSLSRMPFREFSAAEVLNRRTVLILEGVQSLGQTVDACIYLGNTPDVATVVNPPRPSVPVEGVNVPLPVPRPAAAASSPAPAASNTKPPAP